MVITADSDSADPGSIPGTTFRKEVLFFFFFFNILCFFDNSSETDSLFLCLLNFFSLVTMSQWSHDPT